MYSPFWRVDPELGARSLGVPNHCLFLKIKVNNVVLVFVCLTIVQALSIYITRWLRDFQNGYLR